MTITIQTDLSSSQVSTLVQKVEKSGKTGDKGHHKTTQERRDEVELLQLALGGHIKGKFPGNAELGPLYRSGGRIEVKAEGGYSVDYLI